MTFLNILNSGLVASFFPEQIPLFILCYLLTALAAYALGSINFAILLSKRLHNDDIRRYGSGNAGMTNMLRTYGKRDAVLTLLGDALKTALAIFIGMLLVGRFYGGSYVAGLFAVIGHVFPCYYGFKGGKGVVVTATTILMLNPLAFAILLAAFIIIVAIWRYISLGSILCAALYPFVVYLVTPPSQGQGFAFLFALVMGIFIIILHRANLERLFKGKESKVSFGKKKDEPKTFTVQKNAAADTKNTKNTKKK